MNDKLDNQLHVKYPLIFKDRFSHMSETAMCWGFECGEGWYNILDVLCGNIQGYIDHQQKMARSNEVYNNIREQALVGNWIPFEEHYGSYGNKHYIELVRSDIANLAPKEVKEVEQVVAIQVKEKFGTLRFYYDGGDDVIAGMVSVAESMSGVTCEECGNPGTQNGTGWIRTTCQEHKKKK